MLKQRITWLLLLIAVILTVFGLMGATCDNDDDDSDGNAAACNIPKTDFVTVPNAYAEDNCEKVGIHLVYDGLYQTAENQRFALQGQYAITTTKTYYLRGEDYPNSEYCYDTMKKSGTFMAFAEFNYPRTEVTFEVVTQVDFDAVPFCSVRISTTGPFTDDDDDDDDSWWDDDDSWWDDDDSWWDDDDYWWDDDDDWYW